MINLYIDFDGVILNTIEISYKCLADLNIDMKDPKSVAEYYKTLNWDEFLSECKQINNSLEAINNLEKSNLFNVNILTHVISLDEAIAKIKYIRKYNNNISIIPVPKQISKSDVVNPKGAILIDDFNPNLTEWIEAGGIGIRFDTDLESKGFKVIDRLDDIIEMFKDDQI